jgi:hypothetical protein
VPAGSGGVFAVSAAYAQTSCLNVATAATAPAPAIRSMNWRRDSSRRWDRFVACSIFPGIISLPVNSYSGLKLAFLIVTWTLF